MIEESGTQADTRRLRVFASPSGEVVVPPALAGYVRELIWRDLGERRRLRMGAIRDDLIALLDVLTVASADGSVSRSANRIVSVDAAVAEPMVFLSVARVADQLECSTRHVTELLVRGRLRGSKEGGRWLVLQTDLDNYRRRAA